MNPEWNECKIFINIDDEDLQERYFEITVMDRDKIIGTVNIDLSQLLSLNNVRILDSFFPIFNFEKGLRGEL